MKRILSAIKNFIFNIPFFILSLFIKRDKNIWIVGGWFGRRFADNSSYFFQDLLKKSNYRAIWISRDKKIIDTLTKNGFEAYHSRSAKGIYLSLKAKYHVVDQSCYDINPYTSFGATKVNLWHGFPLKNIGSFSNKNNEKNTKKFKTFLKTLWDLTEIIRVPGGWRKSKIYFLGTSELSCNLISKAFNIPIENMLMANYPRNEFLISVESDNYLIDKNSIDVIEKLKNMKEKGFKIVCYFPTFRDSGKEKFLGTNDAEELNSFSNALHSNKILLVTKLHYATNLTGSNLKNLGNGSSFYKSIVILSEKMDVYPFLKISDALITDYSSVYFDYLWTRKPVFFYPYDLEYYKTKDRGLLLDYEEYTPGPKAYSIGELTNLLIAFSKDSFIYEKLYEDKRKKVFDKVFEVKEGSLRIIKQITSL